MFVKPFRNFIDWLGSHGDVVLAAGLMVVVGSWGFVYLLDKVKEGKTEHFDEWAVRWMQRWHGPGYGMLEEVGRDFTALGGVAVLLVVSCAVAGFLLMTRKFGAMWLVVIATAGGLILSGVLKYSIARDRPEIGQRYSNVYTSSFPSGHSMMAAVVYLTLGSLLARFAERKRVKLYFLIVAMTLTFLVGVSRVYMGVHWPTDVLAGWTAGLVWAIICWLAARQLQRQGAVETDRQISEEET